ncbi:MAG: rhodanese-related sulfurtransferase [Candidatus Azotimanducaceae bacterium]|jgi:rhodanese-related sulfurtransferase
MIDQIFEFILNHPILVGTFVFLLVAFLVNEGKQGGATVNTSNLVRMVNHEDAVIVDVRDKKDFGLGHISGAVHIPFGSIDQRANELDADKPVVLVCKMGQHSSAAGKKLKALGFENVRRLSGGMAEWNASGLPIVKS